MLFELPNPLDREILLKDKDSNPPTFREITRDTTLPDLDRGETYRISKGHLVRDTMPTYEEALSRIEPLSDTLKMEIEKMEKEYKLQLLKKRVECRSLKKVLEEGKTKKQKEDNIWFETFNHISLGFSFQSEKEEMDYRNYRENRADLVKNIKQIEKKIKSLELQIKRLEPKIDMEKINYLVANTFLSRYKHYSSQEYLDKLKKEFGEDTMGAISKQLLGLRNLERLQFSYTILSDTIESGSFDPETCVVLYNLRCLRFLDIEASTTVSHEINHGFQYSTLYLNGSDTTFVEETFSKRAKRSYEKIFSKESFVEKFRKLFGFEVRHGHYEYLSEETELDVRRLAALEFLEAMGLKNYADPMSCEIYEQLALLLKEDLTRDDADPEKISSDVIEFFLMFEMQDFIDIMNDLAVEDVKRRPRSLKRLDSNHRIEEEVKGDFFV